MTQSQRFFPSNQEITLSLPEQFGELGAKFDDRYELQGRLGEGGMGTVWQAIQTTPVQRRVAIKLPKSGGNVAQAYERFQVECQALAAIQHAGIPRLFDVGTTFDGIPFLVMELVRGEPITSHCDRHGLPIADRLQLCLMLCKALAHVHERGIIHRDIKPSNILIESHKGIACPKLLDFGLARSALDQKLGKSVFLTECGQVLGSVQYMSPEQASSCTSKVDHRSDIYSLGAVLYELLVGSSPIERETVRKLPFNKTLELVRHGTIPSPRERFRARVAEKEIVCERRCTNLIQLEASLRSDLVSIVMKCLEKDPDDRYSSVEELGSDLSAYLVGRPIAVSTQNWQVRVAKEIASSFRLNPHNWLLAAFTILLMHFVAVNGLNQWYPEQVACYLGVQSFIGNLLCLGAVLGLLKSIVFGRLFKQRDLFVLTLARWILVVSFAVSICCFASPAFRSFFEGAIVHKAKPCPVTSIN